MALGFKVAQGYLEVDVDYATLDAGIAGIEARMQTIRKLAIEANLPTAAVDAAIADITAKLATLKLKTLAIGGIDQTELNQSLLEIQAKLETFTATHGLDIRTTGISDAIAKLMALRVATDAAAGTGDGGGGGGGRGFLGLTGAAFGFWGILGRLNTQIPLFGGLLAGIPLVRTVGGLHLLADAALEVVAEVVPAAIALAAFGVAASSTVNDIIKQQQAYLTISTALDKSFPGLNAGLQHFTDSVKPEVYILFGEALNTINAHTSVFTTLAAGAGHVLDNLGARAEMALGGNGLEGLVGKGVGDLQTLGNIIGNVFGIFGNILKVLPGYAQLLFGALQNVTGALEAITGSSIVQGLLNIGLMLHGAVLWGGLAVTAIMMLQGPLMSIVGWVGGAINALVKFGVMFSIIAAQEGVLAAATAALGAAFDAMIANPFVWIAVAVGAIVGLIAWLGSMKSAAQQSYDAVEQQLGAATTFVQAQTVLAQGVKATNDQLSQTPKYITQTTVGMHGLVSQVTILNPQWQGLTQNTSAYSTQQNVLTTRMAALNKITGSQATSLADLNTLGVKAGSIATESASAFANQVTQIKALTTATIQLAGFQSGQAAAAQNALTNQYMQETLPAIQKITQAETNLMNVITGGQSSFDTFELGMATMNANLSAAEKPLSTATHSLDGITSKVSLAGAAMAGTSQASYTLNQAFYSQISAAQNVINALQAQSISTGDLTKVVATSMEQMLQYAGSNTAARSTMVDLINNALGPGTVTLKSLNQWIGTNSTSLGTMNGIIGQSTVKAGGLNQVLSTTLSSMEAIATFQAHGGQQAWNTFATDIEKGTTNNKAFRQATIDVMSQLLIQSNNSLPAAQRAFENYAQQGLGLTKKQADALWHQDLPGLQNEIDSLHGKTVNVGLTASASGALTAAAKISGTSVSTIEADLQFGAAGMKVTGGTPGKDSVLAALMPGEVVVPVNLVQAGLVDHLKGMIPGFALGGQVNLAAPSNWASTDEGNWGVQVIQAYMKASQAALTQSVNAAAAQVANVGSGVARWTSLVDKALAMEGLPLSLASKVLYQMQTESGGNPNAINLTDSNAQMGDPSRGLLQVIMSTFDMYHWPGTSMNIYDPLANIAAAINYARAVYGPSLSDQYGGMGSGHGYAAGGFMPAGRWGYVGEGGMEIASARPSGGVDIVPMGNSGGKQPIVNFNYYGTQFPTPEMTAHQRVDLALALGVAP